MARNNSGNRFKDTEFASDSIIDSCILVENSRCKKISAINSSVNEQLKSNQQIEPFFERKNY